MPVKIGGAGDGTFSAPQEKGWFDWLTGPKAAPTSPSPPDTGGEDVTSSDWEQMQALDKAPAAPKEPSFIDKMRGWAGTGLRVGSGLVGSTVSSNLELGPQMPLIGGAIGGLGEAAAELAEGSDLSPARIGVEAGLTAVPLGKVYRTGEMAASALRGAGLAGAGVAGRQWARGESPHAGWGEAADVAIGGGLGALFGMGSKAESASDALSKTAQKAKVAAVDAAPAPKQWEVEPTGRGTSGKDIWKTPPRALEDSGETIGAPYQVPSTPTPLRPATAAREPVRSFLDELRARGTGLNAPEAPYPTPVEPTPFVQPKLPEPAVPYGGSSTGPAPYRSAAKAAAKEDLLASNAARIRQARTAAGAEAQEPTFSETLSGVGPTGKKVGMSTRYAVPQEEEAAADPMEDLLKMFRPEPAQAPKAAPEAQVPKGARTYPKKGEVAQTVKAAQEAKAPIEPAPVAEPRPDEVAAAVAAPTPTASPLAEFLKGDAAVKAEQDAAEVAAAKATLATPLPGVPPTPPPVAAAPEAPESALASFFKTKMGATGKNYRLAQKAEQAGEIGSSAEARAAHMREQTAARGGTPLVTPEGIAQAAPAPKSRIMDLNAPETQEAFKGIDLAPGATPAAPTAGAWQKAVESVRTPKERVAAAYEKLWGKPQAEWNEAEKQAVREQMRKSPQALEKWHKMVEESPEKVKARAQKGRESFLKKTGKAKAAEEEFGGVAGGKAEPGSADDWSFGEGSDVYEDEGSFPVKQGPTGEWEQSGPWMSAAESELAENPYGPEMYHATKAPVTPEEPTGFSNFLGAITKPHETPRDFGTHLTPRPETAEELIKSRVTGEYAPGGRIMPVRVRSKGILELPDMQSWDNPHSWESAMASPEKNQAGRAALNPALKTNDPEAAQRLYDIAQKYARTGPVLGRESAQEFIGKNAANETRFQQDILTDLQRSGYDTIRYPNLAEGIGEPSYLATDPRQIKTRPQVEEDKLAKLFGVSPKGEEYGGKVGGKEPGLEFAEDRPKGRPEPPPQIKEIVKNADLSTPEKIKAVANTVYERLPQFQRANLLFSASGLPANAVVGPYMSGVMAALENGLSGDKRGWQLLKEMHPGKWAKEFWSAKSGEARRLIEEGEMGRAETVSGGGKGSTLTEKYLAMPGVYMTAGDVATRNAAMRAGFTEQEARRFTLTSEPETDQLRRYIDFPKGSPLYNMLFPFRRTAANIWEQGGQRMPGVGFVVQARRAGGGDPMMQQLVQQGIATAMGGGSYLVGANTDPETSKALQKYIQNMGGQYELMTTMGLAAGQLAAGGKDLGAQVKGGIMGGVTKLPLPSTRPLEDIAAFLGGDAKMPGGVVPTLAREVGLVGGKDSTRITPIKVR